MKSLLLMSIVLNVILGFKLYVSSQKPILERIVVEEKIIEKRIPVQSGPVRAMSADELKAKLASGEMKLRKKEKEFHSGTSFDPSSESEWQDEIEKVEVARNRFFEKENIDPAVIEKASKIKMVFQKKQQDLFKDVYPGDPSLEVRRKQLELEEKYQKDMQEVFGKAKWEKFEAFRSRYNQSLYKNVSSPDGAPRAFVPMDI